LPIFLHTSHEGAGRSKTMENAQSCTVSSSSTLQRTGPDSLVSTEPSKDESMTKLKNAVVPRELLEGAGNRR